MIPKDVLAKIRQIEIKTGRLVNDVFSGQYESVFKGRGMEFSEVREYLPGDDIRTIDWNVTARYGRPFVKKFIEERELTIILVVDASASGQFGTVEKFKSEIAAEIGAVLAFSALRNNDKVGMLIFTDRVEKYIAPKKGRQHILRLIREILYFKPSEKNTDIAAALEYLNEILKRRAVVFVISDFQDTGYEKIIAIANKRHDVIALDLVDPREKELPPVGYVSLEDAETGETVTVNTLRSGMRETFSRNQAEETERRKKYFQTVNIDRIALDTGKSYVEPLISFFRSRLRK